MGRWCVGYALSSTIDNCVTSHRWGAQGKVCAGGIVGYAAEASVIQNCSNKGSVSGMQYVGGICGQTTSTTYVKDCFNYGNVYGRDRVGGVTGGNFGIKDGISVDQCVNDGDVSG